MVVHGRYIELLLRTDSQVIAKCLDITAADAAHAGKCVLQTAPAFWLHDRYDRTGEPLHRVVWAKTDTSSCEQAPT